MNLTKAGMEKLLAQLQQMMAAKESAEEQARKAKEAATRAQSETPPLSRPKLHWPSPFVGPAKFAAVFTPRRMCPLPRRSSLVPPPTGLMGWRSIPAQLTGFFLAFEAVFAAAYTQGDGVLARELSACEMGSRYHGDSTKVLKLNKSLYGLEIDSWLKSVGFIASQADTWIILMIHVDDQLIALNSRQHLNVLNKEFKCKDNGPIASFLGMGITAPPGACTSLRNDILKMS